MIGILAGMGPKSTGPFIDQVVFAFQRLTGAKNDIDFPPMMIYSLPTPFYVDRPINHSLMEKTICKGLQKLENCGASFIAIPCNTAHIYFFNLNQCIRIPLLNIVKVTLDRLPKSTKKITILGTYSTIESGIYQQRLQDTSFELVLQSDWQKMIDKLILNVKSTAHLQQSLSLWEELSNELHKANIDTILLACTELSTIIQYAHPHFQIIDSSICLAEAVVKKWEECRQFSSS